LTRISSCFLINHTKMINNMTILMVNTLKLKIKDSFNVDNQGIKTQPLCYRWIHSMTIRNPIISIRVENGTHWWLPYQIVICGLWLLFYFCIKKNLAREQRGSKQLKSSIIICSTKKDRRGKQCSKYEQRLPLISNSGYIYYSMYS
jgi:hypothetical protein